MRKSAVFGSTLLAALAATACQDQATAPTLAPDTPRFDVAAASSGLAPLSDAPTALPSGARLADFASGARVIDGSDYVCSATSIDAWLTDLVFGLPRPQLTVLATLVGPTFHALDVPVYEAAYFQTTATPQTFGTRGEYTQLMGKTEKDLKRFWDIPSADIQFVPMHGRMLSDTGRVAATYRLLGLSSPQQRATVMGSLLAQAPALQGGDFPYFTFNAVAVSFGPNSGLPDKVIVGDGVLTGLTALGFGDVAPQSVVAHEFAHHVQYRRGYDADAGATAGSPAEQTRYLELMADAYAAYFLTHARGASMNQKRVEEFLQVYYSIGDCGFTSAGHHGTPNQRMAAARLGFRIADQSQKQGIILSSADFHARFVAAFPSLIAP